jgi:hypothetical protein
MRRFVESPKIAAHLFSALTRRKYLCKWFGVMTGPSAVMMGGVVESVSGTWLDASQNQADAKPNPKPNPKPKMANATAIQFICSSHVWIIYSPASA